MQYRSSADLNRIIVENHYKIPPDVDLIVGIPRSGMLAANLLALHCNLAFVDLDGFIAGRIFCSGQHRAKIGSRLTSTAECRKALIIDDSIQTGKEMSRVRELLEKAGLTEKSIFAAAICQPGKEELVDLFFELVPAPRVFEWNLMHGHTLPRSCVDIDGVLCVDPTKEQNDDGEKYRDFLKTAQPLRIPAARIGKLVTSRLEKYRGLTEEWLAKYHIQYDELVMMQYATATERQAAKTYASFKANVYANSDKTFFVESSDTLSAEIAKLSGKTVLCVETQCAYSPSGVPHIKQRARDSAALAKSFVGRAVRKSFRMVKQPLTLINAKKI